FPRLLQGRRPAFCPRVSARISRPDAPSHLVVLGWHIAVLSGQGMVAALGILAVVSRRLARASFCFDATPARVAALCCLSPRLSRSLLFRLSGRKIPPRHRARASSALRLFRIRSLERDSRARAPQNATSHALTFFSPRT